MTIIHNGSETILSAINQELAFRTKVNIERSTSTNLIRNFHYATDFDNEDIDRKEDLVFATQVFPVACPRDERRDQRMKKVKFDGVYSPPLP